MNNRGMGKNRYSEILLVFSGRYEPCELALPEGKWDVLCSAEDSFAHEHPRSVEGMIAVEPVSALILGRR